MQREILCTEHRRTVVTFCLMVFLLLGVSAVQVALVLRPRATGGDFSRLFVPLASLCLVYAVYEAAVGAWQRRLLRSGLSMPMWLRYAHILMEVSLPTVALAIVAGLIGPYQALASSVPFLYFLFVFLTTMTLNGRLPVFAGLLAGAQCTGVSLVLLHIGSEGLGEGTLHVPVLTTPGQYVAKGLFLMVCGLLAGFEARRIRGEVAAALRSLEERNRAVATFGRHVSPEVAELLLDHPKPEAGEERSVCVMFLDIRDFSSLAAERSPGAVMEFLNTLFGAITPIIDSHRGIVNKFLGDGFMAVFGAPVPDPEACRHAVDAALAIVAEVRRLNEAEAIPEIRIGIGIHVGRAITGCVGSEDRRDYTVIGDVVNVAARIEQANKRFDSRVLVSDAVWEAVRMDAGLSAESLGPVELKGKLHPLPIFRLA
ncbi:MAG: adenylate/guanylate cyclase domain-containing protein [Lentisphaeria bacterium]|nr:adenylate/guanylate cyclase domain-containing protein [Lentisphaeria bacterium]